MHKHIALVGVGGAGMNSVERIAPFAMNVSTIVAVNRDLSRLRKTTIDNIVALHAFKNDRNYIKDSVITHMAEFRNLFEAADHIIIFAGLGGFTGSFAAPELASLIHKFGKPVWAVVYQP